MSERRQRGPCRAGDGSDGPGHAGRVRAWLAPGWLDARTLKGKPPGADVELTLVGVGIQRWSAVSGWSLAEPRGPKPVKRLVPAGGVYFFETGDDREPLAARWLEPVSDDAQDRNDGFGLAAWGIW